MYDFQVDATGCAPAYVTIGDAGNIEGVAMSFISKARGMGLCCFCWI
jgi:hypothetical protein